MLESKLNICLFLNLNFDLSCDEILLECKKFIYTHHPTRSSTSEAEYQEFIKLYDSFKKQGGFSVKIYGEYKKEELPVKCNCHGTYIYNNERVVECSNCSLVVLIKN